MAPQPPQPARLAWLDGLRGIAAFVVVLHHAAVWRFVPQGEWVARHFDLGVYGIMVFFLVSGWIIPASLHRRGDVRAFWIGRLFRIYPLLVVTTLVTMLVPDGYSAVWQQIDADRGWSFAANLTLLVDFLGSPGALSVLWTLGFEMIFYYVVTALFVTGVRGREGPIALALAGTAVALGGITGHAFLLTRWPMPVARHALIVVAVLVTVAGIWLMTRAEQRLVRFGALATASLGGALLLLASRAPLFESLSVLAMMFAGTVVHGAMTGTTSRRYACAVCAGVMLSGTAAGYLFNRGDDAGLTWTHTWQAYTLPYLAAWATFGLGALLSGRSWPRALSWLGAVSYSVYIVHVPVIWASLWVRDRIMHISGGPVADVVTFVAQLGAVLAISQVTYRWVELPGQRVGRRIAARGRGRHHATAADRRSRSAT